jgi:hypothetical protein
LILAVGLSGCAGIYFHSAGEPPSRVPRYELADWPYVEYWTGIVFNGAKIGFTHLSLSPAEDAPDRFDIRSEAVLRFRFLALDKKVVLKSHDRVASDLSLERFNYDFNLDGNRLKLCGRLAGGVLGVEIRTQGQTNRQTIPVEGKLYPTGVIGLYPLFHGLKIGRLYSYPVYDGETQTVSLVTQKIVAYEESKLFPGKAFRIRTKLHGQEVTTWMDAEGRPQLEMSLGGVLISGLESENMAKDYLAQSAISKEETLLDFSLIKTDVAVPKAEQVTSLDVALFGMDEDFMVPTDELQRCARLGREVICRIEPQGLREESVIHRCDGSGSERYLRSSFTVPSRNRQIRRMVSDITSGAETTPERVHLIVQWLQENIEQKPVDVFTALDVLRTRKAECQGHALLYAAFARAVEIPTRVVNGIVYSDDHQGFLYHAWAESLVEGRWVSVDPTFAQVPTDATHIKLVEGETPLDLLPLVDLIGRLQVRIIDVDRY